MESVKRTVQRRVYRRRRSERRSRGGGEHQQVNRGVPNYNVFFCSLFLCLNAERVKKNLRGTLGTLKLQQVSQSVGKCLTVRPVNASKNPI